MFSREGKATAVPLISECRAAGLRYFAHDRGQCVSRPTGKEVDVTESEVPEVTGTRCTREMLRRPGGALRERSSAWTSSSRAARQRCPSGSASTWPRS
ncbi:hypothetical protein EF917_17630 [Streptomyces sp. WAC00469]|nr:hypothetical protein EF917_17630 [Streptomyces sp. WAC00469]